MHSRPCHALMSEPFSMILFENKHNTWILHSILLKHRCKSSFIQNYTKIKICVFIAVKYMMGRSSQCYIPSFVKISPPVLEMKIFGRVFTIYGHGSHLGHVTRIMLTNFHFLVPESFHTKFSSEWPSSF